MAKTTSSGMTGSGRSGTSGGSSGASGSGKTNTAYDRAYSDWQSAKREASQILDEFGVEDNRRLTTVLNLTQKRAYDALEKQVDSGSELKRRMSQDNTVALRDYARYQLVNVARQVSEFNVDRSASDGGAKELTGKVDWFRKRTAVDRRIFEYTDGLLPRSLRIQRN